MSGLGGARDKLHAMGCSTQIIAGGRTAGPGLVVRTAAGGCHSTLLAKGTELTAELEERLWDFWVERLRDEYLES